MIKKKYTILFPITILMVISFFNMYNARYIDSVYDNHLLKQIIFYLLGFFIIFIFSKINIKKLFDYSLFLYIISIFLLILVLFIGKEVNGAKAWFDIGFFSIQPSEFTKVTLSLYLTKLTYEYNNGSFINDLFFIIKVTIITLIPSILVFIEPDTGAIIFYLLILLITLIHSNINKKWFIPIILLFLLFISFFIYLYFFNQDLLIKLIGTSFFYRFDRIFNLTNNYQIINSLTLIGSSPILGNGLRNISLYVPEAPTDFVFAFTIGNFGIITALLVMISYIWIFFDIINSTKKANSKLFAYIFFYILLFQTLYNILMNIGILPIMGIPLPFLSYGGSALLVYFIFIAIYLKSI